MKNSQKKQNPKKVQGIGGWLYLPIIGMFLTIGMQLFDLVDTLLFYEIAGLEFLVLINLLMITLAGLCLYNIFKKNESARGLGIAFYAVSLFLNLFFFGSGFVIIGNVIWMTYFIKSERVKNTFVN